MIILEIYNSILLTVTLLCKPETSLIIRMYKLWYILRMFCIKQPFILHQANLPNKVWKTCRVTPSPSLEQQYSLRLSAILLSSSRSSSPLSTSLPLGAARAEFYEHRPWLSNATRRVYEDRDISGSVGACGATLNIYRQISRLETGSKFVFLHQVELHFTLRIW